MSTTELPHCLLIPKSPMLSTCPSKTSRWSSALLLRRKAKMVLTKVTSSLTINKRRRMAILSPASSQLLALLRMFLVLFLISKWRLLLPPCPHPTVTIACWSVDLLWIFPLVVTLVLTFATKWMTAEKLLICILGSCETMANTCHGHGNFQDDFSLNFLVFFTFTSAKGTSTYFSHPPNVTDFAV